MPLHGYSRLLTWCVAFCLDAVNVLETQVYEYIDWVGCWKLTLGFEAYDMKMMYWTKIGVDVGMWVG